MQLCSSPSSTTLSKMVSPPIQPSSQSLTVRKQLFIFKASFSVHFLIILSFFLFCIYYFVRSDRMCGVVNCLLRQYRLAHKQWQLLHLRSERNVRWWDEHLCSEQGLLRSNADDTVSVHHHQTSQEEEETDGCFCHHLGQFCPQSHFQ